MIFMIRIISTLRHTGANAWYSYFTLRPAGAFNQNLFRFGYQRFASLRLKIHLAVNFPTNVTPR